MKATTSYHAEFVDSELKRRIANNPRYSLRSFARDLGVGVSWLSEFLNGKKGMSIEAAHKLSRTLGLSQEEHDLFVLSVKAKHARSAKERKRATTEMRALKSISAFKMSDADFAEAHSWHHQAILETLELQDFNQTEAQIARRLGLPLATIKSDITELKKIGLLKTENGRLVACFNETTTSNDKPSAALRDYHRQILQKSTEALTESSVMEREFQSVLFAFDSTRVEEAKKAIRKFQKEFCDQFYLTDASKDSIYQLSMQFFRLDKRGVK